VAGAFFVLSVSTLTTAGAIGATLDPLPEDRFALPSSVIEAAELESDDSFVPEVIPQDQTEPSATSLAALVSHNLSTETGSREDECLAVAVFFESKSESLEGQLAVARTVINRAKSGRFPSSLCGVVTQPSQFSFVRSGRFPAIARSSRDWREAVAIARIARNDLWKSPVPHALFFHATHVSPKWNLKRIASVGNHVFYR
jgi:N-acetylmuramoyl-L-alanine amidase